MTEPDRRPTRRDLLRDIGVDVDTLRMEEERRESGCVIRSLQSALGAQATEKEWEMRLKSLRTASFFSSVIPPLTAFHMDIANIWRLIKDISAHDTPLGNALREVELEDTTLTGREIKSRIETGEKVCIIGGLAENGNLVGFHMAHIGLEGETIISRSDENTKVELRDDTEFLSLIFYPKAKPD